MDPFLITLFFSEPKDAFIGSLHGSRPSAEASSYSHFRTDVTSFFDEFAEKEVEETAILVAKMLVLLQKK